jgi:hypothetical protein
MTCWRRLHEWMQAGVWQRIHGAILRRRGIAARIARYGVESRERRGRWRWVLERPLVGCIDFAGCESATSTAQTFIRPFFRLPAHSSVGGTLTRRQLPQLLFGQVSSAHRRLTFRF